MDGEQKRSGWKIWLYMTPLYILLAIPLVKWTMKLNSPDVKLSKDEYSAFNSSEGELKREKPAAYDPGLSDLANTIRYRSGGEDEEGQALVTSGGEDGTASGGRSGAGAKAAAKPGPRGGQYRPQSGAQAALESQDTKNKSQMSVGAQKGYLTYAVGKAMSNPKAVSALFNNSWVVKGFMGRDTVKAALGSEQGLKNYLNDPVRVNNFLGNPVVKAAMNNPAVVSAFAGSSMASSILNSPAVQQMMQDPQAVNNLLATNPQLAQVLGNQAVMTALANNPQTAGIAGALGGGMKAPSDLPR